MERAAHHDGVVFFKFCLLWVSIFLFNATADDSANCVMDCSSLPAGHYQSCESCEEFVLCAQGRLYLQTCPPGLSWDDNLKLCHATSSTCQGLEQSSYCIEQCKGLPDGNYQSCQSCQNFATCISGQIYEHQCPEGLEYDASFDLCTYQSSTCPE
ncbi:chitin binding peritrophin-A domain-containing protein [Algicola sagamiensis]|uniref:chitin binding peritrophin-A domain-containing protein n=1 Tax=Algicola sagamiensis TaxID=163869 RepID=UPI0003743FDC|nr:chitin binding peritrophin-A domain-containing protein [Algicola sagamiensis]